MDLEQASVAMKEKIIDAREKIIYSQSWVADGLQGYVYNRDGNIIEEIPQFSDLFPANWEVPSVNYIPTDTGFLSSPSDIEPRDTDLMTFFHDKLTLCAPPANSLSPAFCTFSTSGSIGYNYDITHVYTEAVNQSLSYQRAISSPPTYNVGYANATTGESLGWKSEIRDGESVVISVPPGIRVAVRASMNPIGSMTSGVWDVAVRGFMHIYNDV